MPVIHLSVDKKFPGIYKKIISILNSEDRRFFSIITATAFLEEKEREVEIVEEMLEDTEFTFSYYGKYDIRCFPVTLRIEASWSESRQKRLKEIIELLFKSILGKWPLIGNNIQILIYLPFSEYITYDILKEGKVL